MESFVTLTPSELLLLLRQRYPYAMIPMVADSDYNIPTENAWDTYKRELSVALFDEFGGRGKDYNDCDNFAIIALALAYRKHYIARYAGGGSAQGIAVGFIRNANHQFNFRITPNKQVCEFEPQTRQDLTLTPAQCEKILLVYI